MSEPVVFDDTDMAPVNATEKPDTPASAPEPEPPVKKPAPQNKILDSILARIQPAHQTNTYL